MNGVICELCLQRPATCHLTEARPDHLAAELHICSACIGRLGLDLHAAPPAIDVIHQMWAELGSDSKTKAPGAGITINLKPGGKPIAVRSRLPQITCPECGLSLSRYRQQNRFGCPECYTAFGEHLDQQLQEMHGENRHIGRVPGNLSGDPDIRFARRLLLHRRLEAAIGSERYEEAAGLRDELRALDDITEEQH